jgi:hypothetical protein
MRVALVLLIGLCAAPAVAQQVSPPPAANSPQRSSPRPLDYEQRFLFDGLRMRERPIVEDQALPVEAFERQDMLDANGQRRLQLDLRGLGPSGPCAAAPGRTYREPLHPEDLNRGQLHREPYDPALSPGYVCPVTPEH